MNNFLQDIIEQWSVTELTGYIDSLEVRMKDTHVLLKELKAIRKKKIGRKTLGFDNGLRGGK